MYIAIIFKTFRNKKMNFEKKWKKLLTRINEFGIIYERWGKKAKAIRSLKTKQETSIQEKQYSRNNNQFIKKTLAKRFESYQMESLILAQDERWRHA